MNVNFIFSEKYSGMTKNMLCFYFKQVIKGASGDVSYGTWFALYQIGFLPGIASNYFLSYQSTKDGGHMEFYALVAVIIVMVIALGFFGLTCSLTKWMQKYINSSNLKSGYSK